MTRHDRIERLVLPWSGWLGAALGWALTHQFGSYLAFDQCGTMHPLLALLIGLIGLVIAAVGGLLSRRAYHHGKGEGARLFISMLGMLGAVLFAVAIIFQTMASLIIPRCFG